MGRVAMYLNRRSFLSLGGPAALCFSRAAQSQVRPFRVFIQREERWPDVVGISDCILGKLYVVQDFPSLDGTVSEDQLGSTLELPWRNDQDDISRIRAGMYRGHTRRDGDLGWRIQLDGTRPRDLVEIHLGNYPADTHGCILLGTGRSSSDPCMVTGSASAMGRLRDRHGTTDRDIEIVIRDA